MEEKKKRLLTPAQRERKREYDRKRYLMKKACKNEGGSGDRETMVVGEIMSVKVSTMDGFPRHQSEGHDVLNNVDLNYVFEEGNGMISKENANVINSCETSVMHNMQGDTPSEQCISGYDNLELLPDCRKCMKCSIDLRENAIAHVNFSEDFSERYVQNANVELNAANVNAGKKRKQIKKDNVILVCDSSGCSNDALISSSFKYEGYTKDTYIISPPDQTCPNCEAIMWKEERTTVTSRMNSTYGICCNQGKVLLQFLKHPPPILGSFLDPSSVGRDAKRFRTNIRRFNSMFSFTSLGANIDYSVVKGRGPYTFRRHGQNYHQMGSLTPQKDKQPCYAQLYIYDTENEITNRYASMTRKEHVSHNYNEIDKQIIRRIQEELDKTNRYVKDFRIVHDLYKINKTPELSLQIVEQVEGKMPSYNKPVSKEIAGLMIGDIFQVTTEREIVVSTNRGKFEKIKQTSQAYMPLQYPLLFPYGEDGWYPELRSVVVDVKSG